MAFNLVSSGTTVSNAVLNNGDIQQITSSGTTVSTVINSGGTQNVYGNNSVPGVASGTIVNSSGVQDVSAGAAYATMVNAGGSQIVENNGTASGGVVSGTGANITVRAGGVDSGAILLSGGSETVGASGVASGTSVQSAALLTVSGGSTVAMVVSNAGSAVLSAGSDYAAVISNGGVLTVFGGADYSTNISSGGSEYMSGGVAYSTTIQNGGVQVVRTGAYTSGVTIQSGGSQLVSAGATAQTTVTSSGGVQTVSSGGAANSGTVLNGGVEIVLAGGTTYSANISTGGNAYIGSGAVATLGIITGGTETVSSGAVTSGTRINTGTEAVQAGGLAAGAIVYGGILSDAGTANGTTMSGGTLAVSSGGLASGSVLSAGVISVGSGGTASATYALGGSETVAIGGLERGATITGTAQQLVSGTAINTLIVGGGRQFVNGGVTTGTTVNSGGTELVQSGGTASSVIVNAGGVENVAATGTVMGVTINTSGTETVSSGATISNATVAGGLQTVLAGGVVTQAVLTGAGLQTVSGTAIGTVISTGASQRVFGVASGATVSNGGQQIVLLAGTASSSTVSAGGTLTVSSGGTTSVAQLTSGATETVYVGGSAQGTLVGSAATLVVSAGLASNAVVSSGGAVTVISGGTASGTTVLAGAVQTLSILGAAADAVIAGGTEVVSSGGVDRRAVVSSGGMLNVVSSGVANATTVRAGGLESVFLGGTASAAVLMGGMQTVSSGGIAISTLVSSGGVQQVGSGGVANAATVVSAGSQTVAAGGVASAAIVQAGGQQIVASAGSAGSTTVSSGGTQTVLAGGTATLTALAAGGNLVNHGTTSATSGTAVNATGDNASVVNDGVIIGTGLTTGVGIVMSGGTVTNSGSIIGLDGTAIRFGGTTSNRLIITAASTISGVVSAAITAANTLELTGAPAGATLSGYTAGYIGFQTLQVDSGSTWDIAGTSTLGAVINDGTLTVGTADRLTVGGAVTAAGTGGTFQVSGSGVLTLNGAVASTETVVLNGTTAELILGTPSSFAGTVSGFSRGDIIDLSSLPLSGTTATLSGSQILVQNGATSYAINLGAPVTGSSIKLLADASGKTEITLVPTVTEALASDTGFSAIDKLTSIATLTGIADANAVVRLTENGTQVATTTANASGVWSVTPVLADGAHTIVATDVDAAGNTGSASLTFTLDTHATAAPTLTLAAASDSNVVGDNITNVTTPTLSGTAITGDLVSVYDGGTLLGTVTAVGGAWSLPVTTVLADGSHVLSATDTDPAGNVSAASTLLNLVVDTTAPAAPSAGLSASSDSGTQGDLVTNVVRPVIAGSAAAGSTIALFDGSTLVGTTTALGNGTYTVLPNANMVDGSHTLTVKATDTAGNVSPASASVVLTIDTQLPASPSVLALDAGSDSGVVGDNLTNVARPTLSGTGTAGDTITLYDGGQVIGTTTVQPGGAFSVAPTAALSDGTHSFTTTQTDNIGNTSLFSAALAVTIKTAASAAPVLTLAPASDTGVVGDRITNVTHPNITGTGTAGNTIILYDNGTQIGSGTVAANGTFSITPATSLADGTHSLTATATDAAANVSVASTVLAVTIDTVPPAATSSLALAPASDSGILGDDLTNVIHPAITGTGVVGSTVTLYVDGAVAGTGTVAADGTFSVAPTNALANGTHLLTTTEADVAGNVSTASASLSLTIDTVPPVATSTPVLAPASDSGGGDGYTSATRPAFTGTGVPGEVVTLYDHGVAVGTATVGFDTTFSVTPTAALTDGAHQFTTTQTDTNSNVSPASTAVDLTIKATPPAPPFPVLATASDSGVLGDHLTNVTRPAITGVGNAGDTVTLYDGTTPIGSGTVAANGTFSIMPGTGLADGTHSLTVTETDLAANVSQPSTILPLVVDTSIPATPVSLTLTPGSDSGVAGDGVTNAVDPAITGTGTAGSTVTLYDNGTVVGTGIVAANGTFSVAPAAALVDGVHSFTTTQTSPVGNTSLSSLALAVTIDTSLPVRTSALALDQGSDSGNGDGYTNVTRPVLTGTGIAGDTVTLLDGGMAIGTTIVGANGIFAVSPTAALGEGTHVFTTTQTNAVGNTSAASAPLNLVTKTIAPAAPATVLASTSDSGVAGDGLTNVTLPFFTGTGVARDTITLYDNGMAVGTATIAADGTFSVAPLLPLTTGPHSFTTTETDLAANVSAPSATVPVTIVTALPASTGGLALAAASDSGVQRDSLTSVRTPFITGTGTAGDTVTLYDAGTVVGTGTVAADGTFSVQPAATLTDGLHPFTTTQTDAVGNTSLASAPLGVTIDTTASAAPAGLGLTAGSDSGALGDGVTNVTRPTIAGTGSAGDTVTLYDAGTAIGIATVGADGSFAITPTVALANGVHAFTAKATDPAGNVSVASVPLGILIDAAAPAAPAGLGLNAADDSGSSHTDGITNVVRPAIRGTGTPGNTITLLDGGLAIGTATVATDGTYAVTPTNALANGLHSLTTTSTSVAGTVSAPSTAFEVVIDTIPPFMTVTLADDTGASAVDGITTDPALTGVADPYAIITLTEGGAVIGTTRSNATGAWAFTPTGLADGAHTIVATESVSDTAGNAGTATVRFTLNTSQPLSTGIPVLAPASDSGVLDGVTNATRPLLTGTGTAGDTVTLYDGGVAVGTALVQPDGTFAVAPLAPLADGPHSLTSTQSTPAGVASAASAAVVVTIDTALPATLAAITLSPSSDSGTLGDGLTNVARPSLSGEGSPGNTITLYDGGMAVGTALVQPDGSFGISPAQPLTQGLHRLSVTQTDAVGNVSTASSPLALDIKTSGSAAPAGSLALSSDSGVPGDNVTNARLPAITGAGTPGDTISLYDAGALVGVTTVGVNGTFSVAPASALVDGVHSLSLTATDAASNVSAISAPIVVTVDTAIPTLPGSLILSAASDSGVAGDGITNVTHPVLTGTGTPGDTVTLLDGTTPVGTATVAADGTFSMSPVTALADGVHRLSTTQTDLVGNVSALSNPLAVTVATSAPATMAMPALSPATDSGVAGDGITNVTRPVFTGTGTPGDTVTLLDGAMPVGTTTVAADGTFSMSPVTALADGLHQLSTTHTDTVGNISAVSGPLAITLDTMAPAAPAALLLAPASDSGTLGHRITSVALPTLTGTAEPGSTVKLYDGTTLSGTGTADPTTGAWSITATTPLSEGLNTLTATSTDAAGNTSAVSGPLAVTLDTTAPAVIATLAHDTGASATDRITADPTLAGSGDPGATVTLTEGGTLLGTTTADASGAWSFTPTLADGAHSIVASETDAAGNTGTATTSLTLTATAPVVTGVTTSPGTATVTTGQVVTLALSTSQDVTIAGGTPKLTLNNGGVATYDSTASTPTNLVFKYTVALGQDSADLSVTGLDLAGATITNTAGKPANVAGAVVNPVGTLQVNTGLHPFTPLVTSNPDPAAILTVRAAISQAVSGTYSNLGIGSIGADGTTYTVTGTTAQVNAALAGVLLSPAQDSPAVTGLTATVSDADSSQTSQLSNTGASGSVLVASTPGDVVRAGPGSDTLTGAAAGNVLLGGAGNNTLIGSEAGSTMLGGTGNSTFFSRGGPTLIVGGAMRDTISAAAGNVSVVSAVGGTAVIGLGSGPALVNGRGADTIIGGSGDAVIGAQANSLVSLTSGSAIVSAADGSTVLTGSGNALVAASGAGILMFQGTGTATFIGGSGSSTVVGGTGGHSAFFAGAGGGVLSGGTGGGNVIVGGQQATTIFGGGDGDLMFAVGSAGTVLAAGAGNETLQGGYSSGNNIIYAGSGNDLIALGSGQNVVFAGSGSATVIGGAGRDLIAITSGRAGGTETLYNFKAGTDAVSLQGYGAGEAGRALAGAQTVAGTATQAASTTVTLSDNTRIIFQGVSSLRPSNFA